MELANMCMVTPTYGLCRANGRENVFGSGGCEHKVVGGDSNEDCDSFDNSSTAMDTVCDIWSARVDHINGPQFTNKI